VRRVIRFVRPVTRIPQFLLVGLLKLYQLVVSPLLGLFTAPGYGQTCRFYPSCSEYALVAVQRHGVVRGSWLAGRRLLRCHPWNPGGVDHVPPVAARPAEGVPGHTDLSQVDGRAEVPAEQSAARRERHAA
jgi:hypothetical protein